MRAIQLSVISPELAELLKLATEGSVMLRTPEGRSFVLAEVDDFAQEVALIGQNETLMQMLDERAKDPSRYSLEEVRKLFDEEG